MVEGFVFVPLGFQFVVIVGKPPRGHGCAVNDSDDPVDGDASLDARPVEGVDERLRQGKAGGFDNDVIWQLVTIEQLFHRWDEIVGNGAADAAIGEFDDVFVFAGFRAAAPQHVAVDAEVTEFVDDQRDPLAAGIREHVTDQRGLARAEKAGDDGGGNFGMRHGFNPSF